MKKLLLFTLLLCISLVCSLFSEVAAQLISKNGTPQAPNYDFETWENPEPWGWNSSSCFEAGNSPSKFERNASIWKSTDKRPGSQGSFSAQIKVTLSQWYHYKFPFGATSKEQMGSLTTGTLYYYDDKGNGSSCIYTNTGENTKKWAFNGRPDSVVFWVKTAGNGGRNSDFTMYLHNDAKLEDRNPNGTTAGTVIGSASCKIAANSAWHRVSLPIRYSSTSNPNYLLASFTAGNNFRSVINGDNMLVDDMMFIYNPSLRIGDKVPTEVARRKGSSTPLNIPFEISGTMSPFNNLPDNEVIAYLSDQNGDFSNQIEIGRITSDANGTLAAQIPDNIPSSPNYKLKLVSTNYPITSVNITNLDIYFVYRVLVDANKPWAAAINTTDGIFREYTAHSAHCSSVGTGNHFRYWEEGGDSLTTDMIIPFIIDRDYSFVAIIDTNYYDVNVNSKIGGNAEFVDNNQTSHYIIHNGLLTVIATSDFGYNFRGWQVNDQTDASTNPILVSSQNPYTFAATEPFVLTAIFDTNQYNIDFAAVPSNMGYTTNSGTYKHFHSISSEATAEQNCTFQYWRKTGETEPYSYEPVLTIDPITTSESFEAVFVENFYSVTTSSNLNNAGSTYGDSTYSAFILTDLAYVEAFPNYGYNFKHWTYSIDGIEQSAKITQNPYKILENGHLVNNYSFKAHFDTNRYNLVAQSTNGSVSGEGTYTHGSDICLKAMADSGYHFVNWTSSIGDILSSNTELCVNLLTDSTLIANFDINTYNVNLSIDGIEFGEISDPSALNGVYDHFHVLTLEANPFVGSEFRYWIINRDTVYGQASYRITIDGEKQIKAVFSPLRKHLSLSVNNSEYGNVIGDGLYEHAAPASAEAIPSHGYHFTKWTNSSGDIITQNPLKINSLTKDTAFKAFFEINKYELCLNSSVGGNANISNTIDSCATFDYKSEVDIIASASSNYHFIGWKDNKGDTISKESPLRLFITQDSALKALFELNSYDIFATSYPEEGGIIKGNGKYYHGDTATLIASVNFGYNFEGWFDNETLITKDSALKVEAINNSFYTAKFTVLEFPVTLFAQPVDGGNIKGGGLIKYNYNTKVEAIPNTSHSFIGWYNTSGELLSSKAVFYPIINKTDTLIAHFDVKKLDVKYLCLPLAAGKIESSNSETEDYFYGTSYNASAESQYGYSFSHWADKNGNIISSNSELNFSVLSDTVFVAHFSPLQFDINADVTPIGAGTINGIGKFDYSSTNRISAIPSEHYSFIAWCNEEGDTISKSADIDVKLEKHTNLYAIFLANTVSLNTYCEPVDGGSISYNGSPRYFDTLSLSANSAKGYRFVKWDNNSTSKVHKIEVNGDISATAYFEKETYNVTLDVSPLQAGVVNGDGAYKYGSKVQFSANSNPGYIFYAYTNSEGDIISFDPSYNFIADKNIEATALFIAELHEIRIVSKQPEIGQVRGSGLYSYNSIISPSAWTTKYGYKFSHWSSNTKDTISYTPEFEYTVTDNDILSAHFDIEQFTVSVEPNIIQAGTVNGGGTNIYNSEITLKTTTEPGYKWVGFSEYDIIVSTDSVYTFTLDRNRNIVAVFEPLQWIVNTQNTPQGVRVNGTGTFLNGETVSIKASVPPNLVFSAWVTEEGDTLSKENPYEFIVLSDCTIEAICNLNILSLDIVSIPENSGEIMGIGEYLYGTNVEITAIPDSGYEFIEWRENNIIISNNATSNYRILDNSKLTAVFKPKGWQIKTLINLGSAGIVYGEGLYKNGMDVELKAIPLKGFTFLYWSENDSIISDSETLSFIAHADRDIVATFAYELYSISVSSEPAIGATASGNGKYRVIDTVTLSAKPTAGYAFVSWECNGKIISTDETFKFVTTENMYIIARVQKTNLIMDISGYPVKGGYTEGAGEVVAGSKVTIKATPSSGFYFDQWVDENMNTVSNSDEYTFIAEEDVKYIALFSQQNHVADEGEIILYPIPFKNELHLLGNNIDKIYLYNQLGQLVFQCQINSASSSILNTYEMPKGLYTYKVVRNNGNVIKGKAIKN